MLPSILLAALLAASPKHHAAHAKPKPDEHPGAKAFAAELAKEARSTHTRLSAKAIERTLARAHYQQSIIDAITRPAEGKPWKDYRPLFLQQARIDQGIAFYRSERASLEALSERYGVPPEIM